MLTPRRRLEVRRLGLVPYSEGLAPQRELVERRRAGKVPDVLLLLQHPPVITLGVKGDGGRAHVIAGEDQLAAAGIGVYGGDDPRVRRLRCRNRTHRRPDGSLGR